MTSRKIEGFNDEIEFRVINDEIVVIDNGTSYKNKLRNGLPLNTLCLMELSCCESENISEKNDIDIDLNTINECQDEENIPENCGEDKNILLKRENKKVYQNILLKRENKKVYQKGKEKKKKIKKILKKKEEEIKEKC